MLVVVCERQKKTSTKFIINASNLYSLNLDLYPAPGCRFRIRIRNLKTPESGFRSGSKEMFITLSLTDGVVNLLHFELV